MSKPLPFQNEDKVNELEQKLIVENIVIGKEYETGRTINGKKEYAKKISVGILPNANLKTVEHGLTNVTFTKVEGVAIANGMCLPLPYVGMAGAIDSSISVDVVNTNIRIYAGIDRSSLTGIITLYYTKN